MKDSKISESAGRTGIFAFEGDWDLDDLSIKSSIRPVLQLLHDECGVPFVHRRIGTEEELHYYVDKWLDENHTNYLIGYFAFHGWKGIICPGGGDIDLEQLAGLIGRRARGRMLHFSTCKTLAVPNAELQELLKQTRARTVSGYAGAVGWIESAAFDLIVLDALTEYTYPKAAGNMLLRRYKALSDRLGLVFESR